MRVRGLAGALLALASVSCGPARSGEEAGGAPSSTGEASPSPDDVVLAELRRFEGERRAGVDFGALPPSDARLGADPYALARAPGGRFVGLLRGADAVVLLDADLREVARVSGVRSPSGLAVEGERVFVVGEGAREVRLFSVSGDRLSATGAVSVPGAALRDVAVAGGVVYTIDEDSGLVYTLTPAAREPAGYAVTSAPVCAGPFRTIRTASALVTACLYDHAIVVRRAGAGGRLEGPEVKLTNDGPFWGVAAMEERGDLLIAGGGAENLPLDRTHGSFENIDSFVYVHRVRFTGAQEPQVTRLAAVNVAAHGVVTPKALEITRDGDALRIVTTGYGGEAMATIRLRDGADPEVTARPLPPGTSALTRGDAGLVLANPLLDAWVVEGATGFELRKVSAPGDEQRSAQSRLGEALIFTTLMAPWNRSDGPLSRFTCETCHFEGYADGRTHATGRGDIVATTKPLLGLWNNRPHFSRALDPDLSAVAHAEFRVAGARSDHDPVFALRTAERPWLAGLGALPGDLSAVDLRRAFMAFLIDFTHRRSAISAGRTAFSAEERRGAELFRERCESCHEARLASDDPSTRVPFEAWEARVLSESAPIVWGQAKYAATGVEPRVHPEGARVPSLRRLYKKRPYLTTGVAKTLDDVLTRVRFGDGAFFHDAAPPDRDLRSLDPQQQVALVAFLRLL
ncbi:MAG: hypothetical protein R3F14_09865 [Polyangiaceae bacterium]